jgi:hypothetical protein
VLEGARDGRTVAADPGALIVCRDSPVDVRLELTLYARGRHWLFTRLTLIVLLSAQRVSAILASGQTGHYGKKPPVQPVIR